MTRRADLVRAILDGTRDEAFEALAQCNSWDREEALQQASDRSPGVRLLLMKFMSGAWSPGEMFERLALALFIEEQALLRLTMRCLTESDTPVALARGRDLIEKRELLEKLGELRHGPKLAALLEDLRERAARPASLSIEVPNVWTIDGLPSGVVHELELDGATLTVRDLRTGPHGERGLGQEASLPFVQAVHILLNLTPDERERFGTERTQPPGEVP